MAFFNNRERRGSMSRSLSEIIPLLKTKDVPELTKGIRLLQKYLTVQSVDGEETAVVSELLGCFTDNLIKHNNFKICRAALKCLADVVDQLGENIKEHLNSMIMVDLLVERLGDGKQSIRDQSLDIILKLMRGLSPRAVFDRLRLIYKHPSARVREYYMICFVGAVQMYGPESLSFSAILPQMAYLVNDPLPTIREVAIQALETMYKYAGDELLAALKGYEIRESTMDQINARLAEVEVVDSDQRVSMKQTPQPFKPSVPSNSEVVRRLSSTHTSSSMMKTQVGKGTVEDRKKQGGGTLTRSDSSVHNRLATAHTEASSHKRTKTPSAPSRGRERDRADGAAASRRSKSGHNGRGSHSREDSEELSSLGGDDDDDGDGYNALIDKEFAFKSDDSNLSAQDFVSLAQEIWAYEYDEKLVQEALDRTINVTCWSRQSGDLVGCVRILTDGYFFGTIPEIMVSPSYQNKGIGRRLMELAWNVSPTGLFFGAQPEKEKFYEKLGYQKSLQSFSRRKPRPAAGRPRERADESSINGI